MSIGRRLKGARSHQLLSRHTELQRDWQAELLQQSTSVEMLNVASPDRIPGWTGHPVRMLTTFSELL